jgi:NitT/TauT family transport system substrate-binding protein
MRTMNRRNLLASAAALAAWPTALCAQSLSQLVLGAVPEESVTPALWALESGMFRKARLDVGIQRASSGGAIASGVLGGAYAIGKSALVSVITAHSKGVPFVLIAGGSLYDTKYPYSVLACKVDSPLRTAADLNGKTLAVPSLNDITAMATKGWVDDHGGDSTTLKLIEYPFAQIADALDAGRVDAGFLANPILQQAIDEKKVRVFAHAFDAIAAMFMVTGWLVTADYAAKNQATLQRFARQASSLARIASGMPHSPRSIYSRSSTSAPSTGRFRYASTLRTLSRRE